MKKQAKKSIPEKLQAKIRARQNEINNDLLNHVLGKMPPPEPKSSIHWAQRIEQLIPTVSTPPRKSGKYKGHGSTNTLMWIDDLAREIQKDIHRCNKGIGYDENMALASHLGAALFLWYSLVHRAKSYDPHRPIKNRKEAYDQRTKKILELFVLVNDDWAMTEVFRDQFYDLPHSRFASNGDFV